MVGSQGVVKLSTITDEKAANRCARAIASDISLYNEEKINEALNNDNFFEALAAEIEEGRSYYKSKVTPEIMEQHNFFERALVDVIISRKSNIKTSIW